MNGGLPCAIVALGVVAVTLLLLTVLPEGDGPVTTAGFSLAGAETKIESKPMCATEVIREEIRGIVLHAYDTALQNHVELLFKVWVQDQTVEPTRAKVGMQNGIRAYLRAREDAMKWDIPTC